MTSSDSARFRLRDIANHRSLGEFDSEAAALAALTGGPDGHFSINDRHGNWCEVEVRAGKPYVRHALMEHGNHVPYTNANA